MTRYRRTRRELLRATAVGGLALLGATGLASGAGHEASVTFEDQTARGRTVEVAEATLPEGSFVVVHDEMLVTESDPFGSVVGVTGYKQPGAYADLRIAVDAGVESQTLFAMPHRNTNTSRKYDFVTSGGQADPPYFDDDGNVVIDPATVTFDTPRGP
jgi:hypothetical protein